MRYFGLRDIPVCPVLPDSVLTILLTAGTAQAFDYPAGCDIVRITPGSTVAGASNIFFNPSSSAAQVATTAPTSFQTTSNSSLQNVIIGVGDTRIFQRPRGSTGFSLICASSLPVSVEAWSRAGTTG